MRRLAAAAAEVLNLQNPATRRDSEMRDFKVGPKPVMRRIEGIFFWHTSCDKSFVARKFQVKESFPAAAKTAAMNLRMATIQLGGLRVPPRVRKVPALRRRLPITMLPEHSQPVIIRHTSQNLGSLAVKPRPFQPRM